ncbi:DUF2127 domain-containing protein [Xinfangfangia pollutisoli]|uniref:DUF2127 domain-containing protein n=1 Tax=Xinfangfangia pollutisoli TaxID=2865960 RepID=UPI001CD1A5C5|nr:DUF2127 domain-containing protein [Xinfangfangia pollutisoli]
MQPRPRLLHWLFEAGATIKAVMGGLEALAGLGLLLTPNSAIQRLTGWLTRYDIAEQPHERMASLARHLAQALPLADQHFYGVYLAFHGGLKLGFMLLLIAHVAWAYPVAMLALAGFAGYEGIEFLHSGSPFLGALAVFDLMMIGLVWQEYRAMRRNPARARAMTSRLKERKPCPSP